MKHKDGKLLFGNHREGKINWFSAKAKSTDFRSVWVNLYYYSAQERLEGITTHTQVESDLSSLLLWSDQAAKPSAAEAVMLT